jgi:hypothetical protein
MWEFHNISRFSTEYIFPFETFNNRKIRTLKSDLLHQKLGNSTVGVKFQYFKAYMNAPQMLLSKEFTLFTIYCKSFIIEDSCAKSIKRW